MSYTKYFHYDVGDLLAVPFPGGGYGVGIVANAAYHFNVRDLLFLYGFDKVYDHPPPLTEVQNLRITDAIVVEHCGDLSIREGRWIVIGSLPGFKAEEWPVPPERNSDRIVLCNPCEYGGVNVSNEKYVRKKDFECLPIMTGMGDAIFFEISLEMAVKERHHLYYFQITPHSLVVWDQCIKRAAAAGKVPWLDTSGNQIPSPRLEKLARKAASKSSKKKAATRDSKGQSPTIPSASSSTLENHFWNIIEAARTRAKNETDQMIATLLKILPNFTPQQIKDFKNQLYKTLHSAYTWDLWAASAIMCGGASDDGFEYWRAWLIAQGRETFEAALANPESLATRRLSFVSDGTYEFEELLYAADQAYEKVTKEPLEANLPKPPSKPKGKKWEEDGLPTRLPRLWKKFSQE